MFFGENVNIARYDQQTYPIFERLTEKQLSFFWRPEEVDLSRDRLDFAKLPTHEKHIFISNLKYQILLDSIQGRGPSVAFLPIVSLPELETWIETWSFFETIHSRSYTHIIRNVFSSPDEIFSSIVCNPDISDRASDMSDYYDDLICSTQLYQQMGEVSFMHDGVYHNTCGGSLKEKLYLCLMAANVLESIRFYVSFACSFAFAERKLMEGNAKIIKLIARDEALHFNGTQHIINMMKNGEDDPDMVRVAENVEDVCIFIFKSAAEQEKKWARYLFKGGSMIGLNEKILCSYIDYITNQRMESVGLEPIFPRTTNPLPWMNSWLVSDNVQVAPQETEISSYLVGQIDSEVNANDFDDIEL